MDTPKCPKLTITTTGEVPLAKYSKVLLDDIDITNSVRRLVITLKSNSLTTAEIEFFTIVEINDLPITEIVEQE